MWNYKIPESGEPSITSQITYIRKKIEALRLLSLELRETITTFKASNPIMGKHHSIQRHYRIPRLDLDEIEDQINRVERAVKIIEKEWKDLSDPQSARIPNFITSLNFFDGQLNNYHQLIQKTQIAYTELSD